MRDLPEGELGIDVKKGFFSRYIVSSKREDLIANFRSDLRRVDRVYLATDPDREGEQGFLKVLSDNLNFE